MNDATLGKRSTGQQVLLACGFGGAVFVLTFLILGKITPNYDPWRETISALEFTASATAQRINFFAFGVLLMLFAVALYRELNGGRGGLLIPTFQICSGIGVTGDAIFIHEPLHFICDLLAFNSALLVLFLFAWRFYGDARWKHWSLYSALTGVAMMLLLTAFGLALHRGGPAGMFEKLASTTRTTWSIILVLMLYSGRRLDSMKASMNN